MTTKTYGIWDANAVGPDEIIDLSAPAPAFTVVNCGAIGADYERLVRASVGFASGQHYFELTAYGEGSLPGKFAGGIVTAAHSLSKYVGEDIGYGYKFGDGDIWHNNSSIATVDATAVQITVGFLLDCDADTLEVFVGGSSVATVVVTSGQTWYPAVSVGSDTAAYDINGWLVTGANAFLYPQPDNIGWFTSTGGFGSLRICGQTGFLTATGDTPPNISYDPTMLEFDQFSTKHECSVWPWANQSSGATFGSLALANADGIYDYLTKTDPRDAKVTIRLVPVTGTFADSFVVGTTNIDAVASDGESKMRITLADTLATIQKPLQNRIFPPWVDAGIAGRPYPILLGAGRNIPALLRDEENRIYQVSDASINNVGVLRQQGDRLDPNASPPDYVLTSDGAAVQTQVLAEGKLAGDFSSVGQQGTTPGAVDIFGGAGLFTTWTTALSPPDGWTAGGGGSFVRRGIAQGFPQDYVAEITATDRWDPGNGKFGYWYKFASILTPGKWYNFTLRIRRAVGGVPNPPGGANFGIRFLSALDNAPSSAITPFNSPINEPLWQGDDQWTFTYQCPAGGVRDFYVDVACATGAVSAIISFFGITGEELPDSVPEVPLQPMTLTQYFKTIIEQRAGLSSSDWVQADAEAIDARTNYQGIGNWIVEPTTIEQALRQVCDSYCAVIFTDHLGRIRVRQLIDPATIDDGDLAMELTATNIEYPMNCAIDPAQGLTTSAMSQENYYVYTDNDFVSDFNPVTGIDGATRTRFKQAGQFMSVSTSGLADYYQFAKLAPALVTKFDYVPDCATEINRVNAMYATTPNFYRFNVLFNGANAAAMAQLIFGDGIRVTYPRYGLDDGKKLLVVDTNINPGDFSIELTCWAPS